jgi:hypothetical protein
VQTEDVFRRANEHIAGKGRELGWRFPVPFLCECADTHCFARVEVTLELYEELRSDPQRYLTAPGHEIPQKARSIRSACARIHGPYSTLGECAKTPASPRIASIIATSSRSLRASS